MTWGNLEQVSQHGSPHAADGAGDAGSWDEAVGHQHQETLLPVHQPGPGVRMALDVDHVSSQDRRRLPGRKKPVVVLFIWSIGNKCRVKDVSQVPAVSQQTRLSGLQWSGARDGQCLGCRSLLHLQHPVTIVDASAEDHVIREATAGQKIHDILNTDVTWLQLRLSFTITTC